MFLLFRYIIVRQKYVSDRRISISGLILRMTQSAIPVATVLIPSHASPRHTTVFADVSPRLLYVYAVQDRQLSKEAPYSDVVDHILLDSSLERIPPPAAEEALCCWDPSYCDCFQCWYIRYDEYTKFMFKQYIVYTSSRIYSFYISRIFSVIAIKRIYATLFIQHFFNI